MPGGGGGGGKGLPVFIYRVFEKGEIREIRENREKIFVEI